MDALDALTPGAELGLSLCYDMPLEAHTRHISEALDEGLNTPVTKYSDPTFFGPDTLEPPPITATGTFNIFACSSEFKFLNVCVYLAQNSPSAVIYK